MWFSNTMWLVLLCRYLRTIFSTILVPSSLAVSFTFSPFFFPFPSLLFFFISYLCSVFWLRPIVSIVWFKKRTRMFHSLTQPNSVFLWSVVLRRIDEWSWTFRGTFSSVLREHFLLIPTFMCTSHNGSLGSMFYRPCELFLTHIFHKLSVTFIILVPDYFRCGFGKLSVLISWLYYGSGSSVTR